MMENEKNSMTYTQARAYAELWYQAFCRWETIMVGVPTQAGSRGESRMKPICMGNVSFGGAGMWLMTTVLTPAGGFSENTIGGIMSRLSADKPDLEAIYTRIRKGQAAVSLVRVGGWRDPRNSFLAARAVLLVAEILGDASATIALERLTARTASSKFMQLAVR